MILKKARIRLYKKKYLGGKKMNVLLKDVALVLGGYAMAIMLIYLVGSKKPHYKYFTTKDGRKMRVNMNLILLVLPVLVGGIAFTVLFFLAVLNYGNL